PAMTTDAPSSRNFRAAARPMPVVPPTIRQRLLSKCFDMLSLSTIQRRHAPGILGVKILELLLDSSVADKLMAAQEHRRDGTVHQALGHLAAEHVHDHGAAQSAERTGLVPAAIQVQERISHGSAVIENYVCHIKQFLSGRMGRLGLFAMGPANDADNFQ